MILILDKPGGYIGKKSKQLKIKDEDKWKTVSVKNISMIILLANTTITYEAIKLLAQNSIPVIYANRYEPLAIVQPFFNHGSVLVRREQMRAYDDNRGTELAKAFSRGALLNKAAILRYFAHSRSRGEYLELPKFLKETADEIEKYAHKIDLIDGFIDDVRDKIIGFEGAASALYYETLALLLPDWANYHGRSRRPPRDPVNSALSLGYTMVYHSTLIAISAAGLDPYAGFLHTDRSGRASLVLDLAEEFKQMIVDRTVISMFSRNQLNELSFNVVQGSYRFTDEAKEKFISNISERLNSRIKIKQYSEPIAVMGIIMHQARKIARFLLGKNKTYLPFIWNSR